MYTFKIMFDATENYTFLKVPDSKGIIDDIINTAVKTAEVDEQKTKNLCVSVSHTTRAARPGEVHGKNYFFVSNC
jgi:hypothetical protein